MSAIDSEFNECLLYFIPKVPDMIDQILGEIFSPGSLRPISVGNVDSRIFSNIIRGKLYTLAPLICNKAQKGFLYGRNILDCIKAVSQWFYGRPPENLGVLLLMDFSSAFSTLDKDFIVACLKKIGAPHNWVSLIKVLFTDIRHFLVFSWEIMPHASMSVGTKQGDPCSPVLFVLILDFLMDYLERVGGVDLNHSGYADGMALMFEGANDRLIRRLAKAFSIFKKASNLSLNLKNAFVCLQGNYVSWSAHACSTQRGKVFFRILRR